jgi:hypothetical protein
MTDEIIDKEKATKIECCTEINGFKEKHEKVSNSIKDLEYERNLRNRKMEQLKQQNNELRLKFEKVMDSFQSFVQDAEKKEGMRI